LTGFYSKESKLFAELLIDKIGLNMVSMGNDNGKYLDALETLF
jgi:hypothetical protein